MYEQWRIVLSGKCIYHAATRLASNSFRWLVLFLFLFFYSSSLAGSGKITSGGYSSAADSLELASLPVLSDSPRPPTISEDGLEIDFVFEYRPLGRRYLTVYIVNDVAFLPLFDLFDLLRINIQYDSSQRVVSGFFIDEETEYSIDFVEYEIVVGEKSATFEQDDLRIGNNGFYLTPELFSQMFGLHFEVEPNRLRLTLTSDQTLPIELFQERERARERIESPLGERDYFPLEFPRNRKWFGSGFLDYQVTGSLFDGLDQNSQSLSGRYGFEFLGGDMSGIATLNRSAGSDIRMGSELSSWRYVISDNPYMTTIRAGSVSTQGLSGGRVHGLSFSNEPLYLPVIFDVYPIFGITEPGTQVELLLNNRLVDFTAVDESGEYELFVPIRYGNTTLEVVRYLPDGRIEREIKDLRIPGSFLSPGEVRYTATAGYAENGTRQERGLAEGLFRNDLAASLELSTGLTQRVTATQQLYYRQNEFDPWPEFSSTITTRIGTSYLVNTTVAPNSRYDLQLNTLSVSNFTFSGSYTYFDPENRQNRSVRQQASGGLSLPIRIIPQRPLLVSFSGTYRELRGGDELFQFRASAGFSLLGLRFRVTYRDVISMQEIPAGTEGSRATYTLNTNLGNLPLIGKLTGRLSLTANLDHDVENRQFTKLSVRAYKSFSSRSNFNATFERDMVNGFSQIQAGFQFRFNQVRSTLNTRVSENGWSATQAISGSVGYDDNFRRFLLSERNLVGSSAVSVVQFMDTNANRRYDPGEEILAFDGLGFVTGGQRRLGSDGVLRVWQLPSYRQVNMTINTLRNPNPTAVTHLSEFSLFTDPNRFKLIEIPYDFSGVAIGGIYQVNRGVRSGLGGARFIIRAKDGSFETEERTFSDGGFYVMDIPPGEYTLELSPLLVSFMNLEDQKTQTEFTITPQDGGDFVDGVEILIMGD